MLNLTRFTENTQVKILMKTLGQCWDVLAVKMKK